MLDVSPNLPPPLPQQREAQYILTTLKEHVDAWTRVDTILEFSSNQQTKYYALQILEQVIETRWRALPRNQCDGIRKYIVGLIIKISSVPENLEREKVYLRKLNFILVQVRCVRGTGRVIELTLDIRFMISDALVIFLMVMFMFRARVFGNMIFFSGRRGM